MVAKVHHSSLFGARACAELRRKNSPDWTDVWSLSKSSDFVAPALCSSGCSSQTEYFMSLFNLESVLLKDGGEASSLTVERLKPLPSTVHIYLCFLSKWAGACSELMACLFYSLLLSGPPKFIPLTEPAFLTRVAPLAFRTKSWHSAASLKAAVCAFVCVCVPRAVSLCPYVCLSPQCFQNSDEEEVRFCKTRSQEERFFCLFVFLKKSRRAVLKKNYLSPKFCTAAYRLGNTDTKAKQTGWHRKPF